VQKWRMLVFLYRPLLWRRLTTRGFFASYLALTICPVEAIAQQQPTPISPIVSILAGGTGSNYAIIKINVPETWVMAPCGASNRGQYAVDEASEGGKSALATALAAYAAGRPVQILPGGICGNTPPNPSAGVSNIEFLSWIEAE
jgi:hypothetical protein